MKLSKQTLDILASFSKIGESILIPAGNQIRISQAKEITFIGIYDTEETFEHDFAIYNLRQFLSCMRLFYNSKEKIYDAELEFQESHSLKITGQDGREIQYALTSLNCVQSADYSKPFTWNTQDVKFLVSWSQIKDLLSGTSILDASHVAIVGDGENVYLRSHTEKASNQNIYSLNLGSCDRKFRIIFETRNFDFFESDYEISVIIDKGVIEAKSMTIPLRYISVGLALK